jgi:hypothetical protein
MKKYTIGTWKLIFDDGTTRLIVIKNNAQAKFIADNMRPLRIKEWQAEDEKGNFYQL